MNNIKRAIQTIFIRKKFFFWSVCTKRKYLPDRRYGLSVCQVLSRNRTRSKVPNHQSTVTATARQIQTESIKRTTNGHSNKVRMDKEPKERRRKIIIVTKNFENSTRSLTRNQAPVSRIFLVTESDIDLKWEHEKPNNNC